MENIQILLNKFQLVKKYFSDPILHRMYKWLNDLYEESKSKIIQSQSDKHDEKIKEVEKYIDDYVQCTYISKL